MKEERNNSLEKNHLQSSNSDFTLRQAAVPHLVTDYFPITVHHVVFYSSRKKRRIEDTGQKKGHTVN